MASRKKQHEIITLLKDLRIVDGSGKMIEDPTLANDVCDSALYAARRAYHFRGRAEDRPAAPGSSAYYARQAAELEEAMDEDDAQSWRRRGIA